ARETPASTLGRGTPALRGGFRGFGGRIRHDLQPLVVIHNWRGEPGRKCNHLISFRVTVLPPLAVDTYPVLRAVIRSPIQIASRYMDPGTIGSHLAHALDPSPHLQDLLIAVGSLQIHLEPRAFEDALAESPLVSVRKTIALEAVLPLLLG